MSSSQENIEQLLQDDSFIRWINGEAGEVEVRKWNQWLQQDSDRFELVNEARHLYNVLTFEEEIPETISELNKLRDAVDEYEFSRKRSLKLPEYAGKKKTRAGLWISAAAVLILLISVPIVLQTLGWDNSPNRTESTKPVYTTAETEYGQIQRLTLWDGSRIVLGANSSLTFPKNYKDGGVDVKLEGQAYFSVENTAGEENRKFIVQTSEGEVTVLGTKFNVNTRSEDTEVVVEEGKVHLSMADTLNAIKSTHSYTMKPGEKAVFSPKRKGISVETTDPTLFTNWRKLEFKFKKTPLKKIANRIKEFYGVEVEFRDDQLKDVKFSGTVTNKGFEVLLQGLRILLDMPVSHENDTITFGKSGEDKQK